MTEILGEQYHVMWQQLTLTELEFATKLQNYNDHSIEIESHDYGQFFYIM